MKFFRKPYRFAAVYTAFIIVLTAVIMLDTFVIASGGVSIDDGSFQRRTTDEAEEPDTAASESTEGTDSSVPSDSSSADTDTSGTQTTEQTTEEQTTAPYYGYTNNSYTDANISITIETVRYCDTQVYVVDITLSSVEYLRAGFAQNTYGKNYTETTSSMASRLGAIVAINGDYYGARTKGYVLRNGTLYREKKNGTGYEDLVIWYDGMVSTIDEDDYSAAELLNMGALHVFSFGPTLVKDGQVVVGENDEVGTAMASNPRTAFGMIAPLHYIMLVSNGRTSESAGLSLYELAQFLLDRGCTSAYNLDGGGSATLYFNGEVINKPTNNGTKIYEREVSDIVYIGA